MHLRRCNFLIPEMLIVERMNNIWKINSRLTILILMQEPSTFLRKGRLSTMWFGEVCLIADEIVFQCSRLQFSPRNLISILMFKAKKPTKLEHQHSSKNLRMRRELIGKNLRVVTNMELLLKKKSLQLRFWTLTQTKWLLQKDIESSPKQLL